MTSKKGEQKTQSAFDTLAFYLQSHLYWINVTGYLTDLQKDLSDIYAANLAECDENRILGNLLNLVLKMLFLLG